MRPTVRWVNCRVLPWLLALPLAAAAQCPPPGWPTERLQALREAKFDMADHTGRHALALALLPCLADPSPTLRDGIAFEAYAHWLRTESLDAETRLALVAALRPRLFDTDTSGVAAPFAALVLAELARSERTDPWLDDADRAAWATDAARYLRDVRDYRGFDEDEGWRHGVAHGADLVLQLAANPALGRVELDLLRDAVAAQVVAHDAHFYVYGEPLRLARAMLAIATRKQHDESDWSAWWAARVDPAPLPAWGEAFSSQLGLAKRHNTLGFLSASYLLLQEAADEETRARLLPGLRTAVRTLP